MHLMKPQYADRLLTRTAFTRQKSILVGVRWASQTASGENKERSIQPAPKSNPSDSPEPTKGPAEMVIQQSSSEALVDHQPDYNTRVDHGTSFFSPIPKRVMDGSEPGEVLPAAVLSGAPVDLQARTVRIYRPTKTATQSGDWHGHQWRMDWDILQKGHRWENPLMGWQSTADSMQGTHMNFKSKEDAIHFAQKQGYEYFVQEPKERNFTPKAYASNFTHTFKPLKHIRTK